MMETIVVATSLATVVAISFVALRRSRHSVERERSRQLHDRRRRERTINLWPDAPP